MSFRVWVGDKPAWLNYYDYRLDEHEMDLHKLAAACAWKCPLRVYGGNLKLVNQFLNILADEYYMGVDDVSQVKVLTT